MELNIEDVTAYGAEGKGRGLLDALAEEGFDVVPPQEDQLHQPTSRPRKEHSTGRIIDWIAVKRGRNGRIHVITDSHRQIGTDHDALILPFLLGTKGTAPRRIALGPRIVSKKPTNVQNLTYDKVCDLARTCTKPPPSHAYRDDEVVRELFRIASCMDESSEGPEGGTPKVETAPGGSGYVWGLGSL